MKICTRCKIEKPESDFFADNRRPNGRMSRCKKCKCELHTEYRNVNNYDAKRYAANRESERERHLIAKYNLTQLEYDGMFAAQSGCCAICGRQQKRAFDVDHCHKTGRVRGLLCTSCNRMLGHAGDNPQTLRAGARYIGG